MTTNDFIDKCKNSGKFDDYQMHQIREGFKNGLTFKQVKIYAKPEIQHDQMEQILWGFIDGLTMEQIKLYADSKFDFEQMWEIRLGFESGLTMEEIKLYAKPKFNIYQMQEIREFIINNKNLSINTLKFLIQLDIL